MDPEAVIRVRDATVSRLTEGKTITNEMLFPLVRGALLYAVDAIDESYRIATQIGDDTSIYWRGMIHRREGDFYNSRNCFRRVGSHPVFGVLHHAASAVSPDMAKQWNWDPYLFVGLCEQEKFGDNSHYASSSNCRGSSLTHCLITSGERVSRRNSSMTTLLTILISDVVPIFAIAGVGFLLERRLAGSVKVLSSVSFNALSPCLVFTQLVGSSMSATDAGRMAAFCLLLTSIMGFAARIAAGPLHLGSKTRTSFLLTVMFSNSGNYALPVILFAFGREGLSHASIYFVSSAVILYTAGVFIAAHGGHGFRRAMSGLLRVPSLYALAVALIFLVTRTPIPTAIVRPIAMLSDAAIPMMLLVLGMQLKRVTFPERPAAVLIAVALSLLVAPVIGITLASLLGMTGIARDVAIVVSAMPAAVVTSVLALEFDLDSVFVTCVVFVSTLLSPVTLVLLIAYLKG